MECDAFVPNSSCSHSTGSPGSCGSSASTGCKTVEYHEFEVIPFTPEKCTKQRSRSIAYVPGGFRASWRVPLKALRLLILVALLPALFIAVPLYLRYFVFSGQLYPVGMSDMRLIDKKVSTTWCQRQLLRSNASFNAFLMPSQPKIAEELVPVSMTRHLLLDDDMKEYWGFYLLQGSIVTVSTCVRWPGSSLIMIRGHKHLQECAYIGDDSSEELEEILEANGGKLDNETLAKLFPDSPSNKPSEMMRLLGDIKFHEPRRNRNNITQSRFRQSDERDTPDSLALQKILSHLYSKQEKQHKIRTAQLKHKDIVVVPQLTHRFRDTNINENEEKWLSFKDIEVNKNGKVDVKNNETKGVEVEPPADMTESSVANFNASRANNTEIDDSPKVPGDELETEKEKLTYILEKDEEEIEDGNLSSSEIFDDILNKLMSLGDRGKGVLNRLNDKLAEEEINEDESLEEQKIVNSSKSASASMNTTREESEETADKKLNALKALLIDIMEEQKTKTKDGKRKWKNESTRKKRDILLSPAMIKDLNDEDEKGNLAIEEGFVPDEHAAHHSIINETTPNDMSRSEFWSSFSSSEEALLECAGLILNLPLQPSKECNRSSSDNIHEQAALPNTITYRVPTNGYYFFVFSSENELQTNYIRAKFNLQKKIYDLTNGTVMECKNSTQNCSMPLSFFSTEKVVLEVPLKDNDSLWNEEFMVMSECEPRTSIYLICVITVPILIVVMAFQ